MVYYNPLDLFCKSVTGAVCETEEITFRVKTNSKICQMVIKKDGEDYENYIEMKEKTVIMKPPFLLAWVYIFITLF